MTPPTAQGLVARWESWFNPCGGTVWKGRTTHCGPTPHDLGGWLHLHCRSHSNFLERQQL
jgi:hypothetical protein